VSVESVGEPPHRVAATLAERLGRPPVLCPGDHGGFGAEAPACAAKIHDSLSAA
jgi:hypothetical protein